MEDVYILLKSTPVTLAGAEFYPKCKDGRDGYSSNDVQYQEWFPKRFVESKNEWFKKKEQSPIAFNFETVTPISDELRHKVVDAINYILNPSNDIPLFSKDIPKEAGLGNSVGRDKDYEILSYEHKKVKGQWLCADALRDMAARLPVNYFDWNIHSIKRLSDGEVFSIGDDTPNGKIVSFYLSPNGLCYRTNPNEKTRGYLICHKETIKLNPKKEVLFTTEDGVDIYEGNECWVINLLNWKHNKFNAHKFLLFPNENVVISEFGKNVKYFSTEEKAQEYITLNKPCLSLNDLLSVWHIDDAIPKTKDVYASSPLFVEFRTLVKKKLGLLK